MEEGQIDQTEYDKLLILSKRETTSLALNLLLGLGIVATSIGAIALAPSPYSCFIFGLIVSVIGLLFKIKASDQWIVFSITCLISGLLMSSAAIVWFEDYWFQTITYRSISIIVLILGLSAYFLKSSLLSLEIIPYLQIVQNGFPARRLKMHIAQMVVRTLRRLEL